MCATARAAPAESAGDHLTSSCGGVSTHRGEGIVERVIGEEAARLRREYEAEGLVEPAMAPDPIAQFQDWFDGVLRAGVDEPNAFVLATTDADGSPSARALLMKDFSSDGIVFYTGMESRKSNALRANDRAAATFVWTPLHRQVRFEGTVEEVQAEVRLAQGGESA